MADFAAAVSEHPSIGHATGEVLGQVLDAVGPEPDLAAVFVTAPIAAALDEIVDAIGAVLAPRLLFGSSAVSVIGNAREVEERPAIALWAAKVPDATPVRLDAARALDGWEVAGIPADLHDGTLVVLADPFSFPLEGLLPRLGVVAPELTVIGGLASAARAPGGNRLVLDGRIHLDGAVAVHLPPGAVDAVVSQGCRPVGEPFIVTAAEGNVVLGLGGRPAVERIGELLTDGDDEVRGLVRQGLHLGVVVDERRLDFRRGDFLVRAVLGIDRGRGGVAAGAAVAVGQTVQFQVRDARTASEDLRMALEGRSARGALLFTCNGRGSQLFDVPDHDASTAHELLGAPAVAGMFCAGEIGPVGPGNHLHGFTASLALFR